MTNKKPVVVGGLNLTARFKNPSFVFRFIAALAVPALVAVGIDYTTLTTWGALGDALIQIISNPLVIGLTIYNAYNMMIDPVVRGVTDSPKVKEYTNPSFPNGGVYPPEAQIKFPEEEETPNATMEEQMDELEEQREEDKLKK